MKAIALLCVIAVLVAVAASQYIARYGYAGVPVARVGYAGYPGYYGGYAAAPAAYGYGYGVPAYGYGSRVYYG